MNSFIEYAVITYCAIIVLSRDSELVPADGAMPLEPGDLLSMSIFTFKAFVLGARLRCARFCTAIIWWMFLMNDLRITVRPTGRVWRSQATWAGVRDGYYNWLTYLPFLSLATGGDDCRGDFVRSCFWAG